MKLAVIIAIGAIFCVSSLDASVLKPNPLKGLNMRAMIDSQILKGKHDDSDFLCKPCIEFFTAVKEILGDTKEITKDSLKDALDLACKYLEDKVPHMDEICKDIGPAVIDIIYKYLTEVEDTINPLHDCKLLFMCWGDNASQKSALQQLIVKHKIRLD